MNRKAAAVSLLLAFAIAACADQPTAPATTDAVTAAPPLISEFVTPSFATVSTSISTAPPSAIWRPVINGGTQTGSLYAFYVPRHWNHEVVYYAHGLRLPNEPVDLNLGDAFAQFREALGTRGYAVAFSSYSENGFAVKDALDRTAELRTLFASRVGEPRRSYLTGTSLGGLVAEGVAERAPDEQQGNNQGNWQDYRYDGTLAMCAPLGGTASEITYLGDIRVLFDWFYKGVLPGDAMHIPADLNPDYAIGLAVNAVGADPRKFGAMLSIRQIPLEGTSGTELLTSVAYAIKYDILALDNLLAHTGGQPFYDNTRTVYSSALSPDLTAALNAPGIGVGRFAATPAGARYLAENYTPTGRLRAPTLTLHTVNDPFVPRRKHEAEFKAAVTAAHAANLLVQRNVPGAAFGHCTFKLDEMTTAFDDLTKWVETGVKPVS